MTKRMTMNLKEKIKDKIGDIVKYLFDRFIGCPDIHSIQKYLNNQGLLVYNHYDSYDDQIYDVYFNLSNLDNVTFKCDDISWGSLNSNYIKTFKNQQYLHIGKIDCSNNQVVCYKYLTKFTIENEDGTESARVIENQMQPNSIKFLILKEEWVFDKQRSVMDPRIMWITALREFEKDGEIRKSLPYKVYYPAAQPIYARNEAFNPNNDGDLKSFYDLFQRRYFSSFISRESNVYNNREVNTYKFGIEQLYEAERIKTFIFNFEHDLWEY